MDHAYLALLDSFSNLRGGHCPSIIGTEGSLYGRDGSSSGSNAESVRRCIGWGASRDGTRIYSSCGNSVCGPRLDR